MFFYASRTTPSADSFATPAPKSQPKRASAFKTMLRRVKQVFRPSNENIKVEQPETSTPPTGIIREARRTQHNRTTDGKPVQVVQNPAQSSKIIHVTTRPDNTTEFADLRLARGVDQRRVSTTTEALSVPDPAPLPLGRSSAASSKASGIRRRTFNSSDSRIKTAATLSSTPPTFYPSVALETKIHAVNERIAELEVEVARLREHRADQTQAITSLFDDLIHPRLDLDAAQIKSEMEARQHAEYLLTQEIIAHLNTDKSRLDEREKMWNAEEAMLEVQHKLEAVQKKRADLQTSAQELRNRTDFLEPNSLMDALERLDVFAVIYRNAWAPRCCEHQDEMVPLVVDQVCAAARQERERADEDEERRERYKESAANGSLLKARASLSDRSEGMFAGFESSSSDGLDDLADFEMVPETVRSQAHTTHSPRQTTPPESYGTFGRHRRRSLYFSDSSSEGDAFCTPGAVSRGLLGDFQDDYDSEDGLDRLAPSSPLGAAED